MIQSEREPGDFSELVINLFPLLFASRMFKLSLIHLWSVVGYFYCYNSLYEKKVTEELVMTN